MSEIWKIYSFESYDNCFLVVPKEKVTEDLLDMISEKHEKPVFKRDMEISRESMVAGFIVQDAFKDIEDQGYHIHWHYRYKNKKKDAEK